MDHSLLDQLADVSRLPVAPETVRAVVGLCGEEQVGEIELSLALERDPGMTLWMLRQANSGVFGSFDGVSTIEEAITGMGSRATKILGLSMVPSAGGFVAGGVRGTVAEVWARARMRERVVYLLNKRLGLGEIGMCAQSAAYGVECAWFAIAIADPEQAVAWAERAREMTGIGERAAMSAGILQRWGFGERVCDAVRACGAIGEGGMAGDALKTLVCGAEVVVRHTLQRGEWRGADRAGSVFTEITGLGGEVLAELVREVSGGYEDDLRAWIGGNEDAVRSSAVETLGRLSIAIHAEHNRLVHQRDELLHRVTLDRLTGLFNRGAFDDRLVEEMERARRGHEPLSLLMCDLDDFKLINDRHGHQAGDMVLRRVADELLEAARRIDVVARYGGEEFVVIAPRCDYPGASYLAERLRAAIAALDLEWEGEALRVTVSIGGAVCTWPGAVLMPEQLVSAADRRLYEAKRNGRNCVRIEGPDRLRAWAG